MSDNSSDTDAELGETEAANASMAPPNLAALRAQQCERLIAEQNWHNAQGPDFREGFLAGQYRISDQDVRYQQSLKTPESDTSSMAVSVGTHSTAFGSSRSAPSLGPYSSADGTNSLHTSLASSILQHDVLEEGLGGVLEVPVVRSSGRLACSFSFLACTFSSDDLAEWNTHCKSHFRGHLPPTVQCPFTRCNWNRTATSGEEAWGAQIIHIVTEHRDDGVVDTNRRPDSSLVHHLWRKNIIDDVQLKELRAKGRLDRPLVLLSSAGPAHDRRISRRQPVLLSSAGPEHDRRMGGGRRPSIRA